MTSTIPFALASLLLAGCVSVKQEPPIPFPAWPAIQFKCAAGYCCLTEADTNALNRWAKRVAEFEAARQRLIED